MYVCEANPRTHKIGTHLRDQRVHDQLNELHSLSVKTNEQDYLLHIVCSALHFLLSLCPASFSVERLPASNSNRPLARLPALPHRKRRLPFRADPCSAATREHRAGAFEPPRPAFACVVVGPVCVAHHMHSRGRTSRLSAKKPACLAFFFIRTRSNGSVFSPLHRTTRVLVEREIRTALYTIFQAGSRDFRGLRGVAVDKNLAALESREKEGGNKHLWV